MNLQHIDWKLVSDIVINNSIEAASSVLLWECIGIAISAFLVVFYHKRKIFRRDTNKYYNWAVKLYIPYLFIIGFIFFGKAGIIRFADQYLTRQNQEAVNAIYDRSFGKLLGNADDPNSLIRYAERIGTSINTVDEAMNNLALHVMTNSKLDSNYAENTITAFFIQRFWKKHGRELVSSGVYYLMMMALEKAHIPGEPEKNISYEDFKLGIEKLKTLDARKFENGLKTAIGSKTQNYIDSTMNKMFFMNLLIWILLSCVPIVEWYFYKKYYANQVSSTELKT